MPKAADPSTDFGDEVSDNSFMPQKRASIGGINEWIFGLMRPKKQVPKRLPLGRDPIKAAFVSQNPTGDNIIKEITIPARRAPISYGEEIPDGHSVQNGLLFPKKSLAEIVRDQIKFPAVLKLESVTNGIALLVFAIGACALYAELPTHPGIIVGVLLVTIAGNVIISRR